MRTIFWRFTERLDRPRIDLFQGYGLISGGEFAILDAPGSNSITIFAHP
jgi:hypothetical protein